MTEWKNSFQICEMERELEREDASDNKKKGRYLEIYTQTEEGVFCKTGCEGLEHPLGMFEVRLRNWTSLEKAFIDAGYEIRKPSTTQK